MPNLPHRVFLLLLFPLVLRHTDKRPHEPWLENTTDASLGRIRRLIDDNGDGRRGGARVARAEVMRAAGGAP